MELKVRVNGVERNVSGVTKNTTCAEIIYALAHATGQRGRFVLIEKILDTERSLSPSDKPLEILERWGPYAAHIKFFLKLLDETISDENLCSVTNGAYPVEANNQMGYPQAGKSRFPIPNTQTTLGLIQPIVNSGKYEGASSTDQPHSPTSPKMSSHTIPVEQVKYRPPPPTYHELIEQRIAMLYKGKSASTISASSYGMIGSNDGKSIFAKDGPSSGTTTFDYINMSINDLTELVQSQKQIIEQQKAYIAQLDQAIPDDHQREVFQLERQQENLRAVLNPLRERDWPGHLEYERAELRKINDGIIAIKIKLDRLANEIRLRTNEEKVLWEQIKKAERELKMLEDDDTDTVYNDDDF